MLEAVSFAYWGKTLRGTPLWVPEQAGSIRVYGDPINATRRVTAKGTQSLTWQYASASKEERADTRRTTNARLEQEVGDWLRWHKTHVFACSDGANFIGATDAKRKELIEDVVGVDKFDQGLVIARRDVASVKERQVAKLQDMQRHAVVLSQAKARLASLRAPEEPLYFTPEPWAGPVAPTPEELNELGERAVSEAAAERDRPRLALALERASTEHYRAQMAVEPARNKASQSKSGVCWECKQPLPPTNVSALIAAVQEAELRFEEAKAKLHSVQEAWNQLPLASSDARVQHAQAQALFERYAAWKTAADSVARRNEEIRTRHAAAVASYEKAREQASQAVVAEERQAAFLLDEAADLDAELVEAQEVVQVISGVRSHAMTSALAAVEAVANSWLDTLLPGAAVRIRSWSEKADGQVNDKIDISLEGRAAGYGYKAASGGERRQVLAAVLIGLAEVGSASDGRQGTLWFDEVFDSLDETAVEALASCLQELGQRRPVVVITPRQELARAVRGAQVVRFQG
jgi:hypothetical protein